MPRLFVALEPSPDFRAALSALQDSLREAGVAGRYLEPSNLHMTLAFIGQWTEDAAALLPRVGKPFPITLSHIGVFERADVLWAGVRPSDALDALAAEVRAILDEAGVPYDHQPFNPHITLARKPVIPASVLLPELTVPPVSMTVSEVCLYRSERGENGMEYTVIGRGGKA